MIKDIVGNFCATYGHYTTYSSCSSPVYKLGFAILNDIMQKFYISSFVDAFRLG